MTLDLAVRLAEIGLSLALLQRAFEHARREENVHFATQAMFACLLLAGLWRGPCLIVLWLLGVVQLYRFRGPYNGGADKMAMLSLTCLSAAHLAPAWADVALAYLATQLALSYFVSGWVKMANPDWRSGRALRDVFAFSIYPVSDDVRGWSAYPRLLWVGSWGVMLFEVAFPLALVHPWTLYAALAVAAGFHLANACLFGLNRFLWIWLSVFPALIWLQERLLLI